MFDVNDYREYVINCTISGKSKKMYANADCDVLHNIEYDNKTETFYGTLTLNILAKSEEDAKKSAENTVDSILASRQNTFGDMKNCKLVSYDEHPCTIRITGDVFRCSDSYPFESFKAYNIDWEDDWTVGEEEAPDIPTEIEIPCNDIDLSECDDYETLIDMISEYITEQTGYCHLGFKLEHDNELEEIFNDYE